jgi:uncharacterized protein YkwD
MKSNLFRLLVLIILLRFIDSCSSEGKNSVEDPIPATMEYAFSSNELETLRLINSYRVSIGLSTLVRNSHVSYKAEEHNKYMIHNNLVNHDGFTERYENIIKVLGAIKVSENIAYNYKSPQGALDAWLLSPAHRKVIEGDFTCFGISVRESANGRKYYTNIFVKI